MNRAHKKSAYFAENNRFVEHCSTLLLQEMQHFLKGILWFEWQVLLDMNSKLLYTKKFYVLNREQWCVSCVKKMSILQQNCYYWMFWRNSVALRKCSNYSSKRLHFLTRSFWITTVDRNEQWIASHKGTAHFVKGILPILQQHCDFEKRLYFLKQHISLRAEFCI